MGEITAIVAVFAANPYVAAFLVVLKVVGFFTTLSAEAEMNRRLSEIQQQIDELNTKVSEVLRIVTQLPDFITRALEANTRDEILAQLNAKAAIFYGIIAKYGDASLAELSNVMAAEDAAVLREICRDTLELVHQLQRWGPDAFVAMGQGYAMYLATYRATGLAPLEPEYVRRLMLQQLMVAHELLSEARFGLKALVNQQKEILNKVNKHLFVGASLKLHSSLKYDGVNNCYAKIKGSLKDGFEGVEFRRQFATEINNEDRSAMGAAWPEGGVDFAQDGSDTQLKGYVRYLNRRRAAVLALEKQLKELVPLERACLAMLLTVTAREALPIKLVTSEA